MESNDSDGKISSSLGYKLVPWVSWDEWNYVRKSIFSSSPNLISAALQKISAWESRGCLPIAIDLTAVIIEIHQKDPFFRGDDSIGDALASEKMLNMLYCMFIMRLVNDFVEPAHKETGRSISDLADAVGIPRTLVDIRHESSHRCLPSLKLARSASAKALEWLRDNYWEPQRIAVHDTRRKVKSRLLEMILFLTSRRVSRVKSAKPKSKCGKRTTLLAAYHKFSHTNKMLLASKSDALTVQSFKVTKRAAHLYSLYPSVVVSSLLEIFLSHASDISADIDMECSDDSKRSISEPVVCSLTDFKMVIIRLSNKKPRLLLNMLKTVLEMIEEKDSRNFENDWNHFLSSQHQVEINQVFHLRSLIPFLIRNLKALKESGQIVPVEDNQVLSTDNITVPKILLSNLLHKCLTLLVPGDKHLLQSVLLLSEMCGNRLLIEKLPLLAFQGQDLNSLASLSYNESMLLKADDSIKKAEERLNHLKLRLLNDKNKYTRHMSSNSDATTRRWTINKSWVACPIGMLPCSFSSTAVLPILDVMNVERETNKCETTSHNVENVCAADEDEMVCDDNEFFEDGNPVKILKQTPQNEGSLAPENPFPMQGMLLIGGVWKKKWLIIPGLVNDFVEAAHKETGRSISDLADAIGIPWTLVDIRHESSHRCLPYLKLARSAIAKALEWLRDNYWEPQRIAVHDPRRKVKSRLLEMILC